MFLLCYFQDEDYDDNLLFDNSSANDQSASSASEFDGEGDAELKKVMAAAARKYDVQTLLAMFNDHRTSRPATTIPSRNKSK